VKPGFTVEQVRSFLAVADAQSISRAAEALHLTQGAVTQQVHNFEKAVAVRLVERSGRGIRLTDAGRSLATSCRAALRAFEVVGDSARALKSLEAGSLHLGASPTCASYYLPPLMAGFTRRFPEVILNVTVEPSAEINEEVRAGVLDCALVEGRADPELMSIMIASDELVLVAHATHPLAAAHRVTSAELAKHRYLGRGPLWAAETTVREMIGDAYDQSQVLNLGHPEYVRAAALAGLGYAALPLLAVKTDLETGVLKRLAGPSTTREIRAIRRESLGGPTLEEFWRFIVAGVKPEVANT
jgi:DNA-binding transcriptional LysR family regulator